MNLLKYFIIPLLLICWSICIIISIIDIYYIKNIDKNWSIYDNELLESKNWWICGIPLCIYSLIIEICLLISTIFLFIQNLNNNEFDQEDKINEFRSYNSNYTYSNLYDNMDEYKSNVLNWIDNTCIWNRLIFIITNFLTVMTFYYLFIGLYEYKTNSVTFLLKSGIIALGFILTWLPGVLSDYKENFKLFGTILITSSLLIILLFLRNYQNSHKVMELTSEVLNIKKLNKIDEMINKRIIERYIESGGKYYTITLSPAAIATELEWGKEAILMLKNNNVYIDCNYDQNNNKWIMCIEEKITSYPSWVIGDKTISGIISPNTIAHMVNINLKELRNEVLSLIHPDDKKEIEDRISDFSDDMNDDNVEESLNMNNNILTNDDKLDNNIINDEIKIINNKKKHINSNQLMKNNKKLQNKYDLNNDQKQIKESDKNNELIENIYEQPSFRGMNILNKLDEENKNTNKKVVNLIEEDEILKLRQDDEDNISIPSKDEFQKISDDIDVKNQILLKEEQKLQKEAEDKIQSIEQEQEDNNSEDKLNSENSITENFVSETVSE